MTFLSCFRDLKGPLIPNSLHNKGRDGIKGAFVSGGLLKMLFYSLVIATFNFSFFLVLFINLKIVERITKLGKLFMSAGAYH